MWTRNTFSGWLLLALAASAARAQGLPEAVITGPREARTGSLVILDATESAGLGRLWLLASAPEETSFLAVESGRQCIFASPTPGVYRFVLIVSGVNANGGPAADMATHSVVLVSPVPPTPVPVPPTPVPTPVANPYPAPSAETRAALGAVLAIRLSRPDATSLANLYDEARQTVESGIAARAAGVRPEVATTSDLRSQLVQQGQALSLAGKYAGLAAAVDGYLGTHLGTRVRDLQASDAAIFSALAWAIWEGGR